MTQTPKKLGGPYLDLKERTQDEPGEYVLLVFRPIPFGMGLMTFFVDDLRNEYTTDGHILCRYALQGDRVITRFPASFDYMLVARSEFEFREPEPEDSKEPVPVDPERIGPISHL